MVAGVLPLQPPSRGQDPEMFITFDQIVSNHQDRTSQVVVGVPDQRPSR